MHRASDILRVSHALAVLLAVAALASGCSKRAERTAADAPPAAIDSAAADSSPSIPTSAAGPEVVPATADGILAVVRAAAAPVTLVNVWATWCAPCREEFPDLIRFERAWHDRGVRVVLVSADFEDQLPAVREFLAMHHVTARSWIKTGDDMGFIDGLDPKWSGALPATFVYDATGTLQRFWEGKASYDKFESAAQAVLGRGKTRS